MSHHTRTRTGGARGTRGLLRSAAVVVAAGLALTACAQEAPDNSPEAPEAEESVDPDAPVTIKFSWWGSDTRHELTQQVLDNFMEKHPNITVVSDFTDWNGYWDKLATTVAASDAPDVITQEERYLRDYATRGVLADITEYSDIIDLENMDESILASGEMEGGQYGLPTGVNAYAILANTSVFEQAGVELPDDETWTWDDYVDVATEISEKAPEGMYGTQDYGFNEPGFAIFARQRGEALYNEDGSLGFSEETLAEWWEISLQLRDQGATPPAAETVEVDAGGPEQSLVGTNRGGMAFFWTNQLGAVTNASGQDIQLLRHPGESEHERTGMYFKPAMFYSMSANSEHPEAAATLIDYLLNDPEAAEVMLSDRGLPANTEVRAAVIDQFSDVDKQAADFLSDLEDEIVDGLPVPPVGAGEVAEIIRRINAEVLFDRLSPEDAAAQFVQEVEAATGQ
ncbi:extracellular solute-binding protein [Actinotalea ferrariae]|uniref:ABC transporter substrate-binding protein n=1 Tax=Actinotalea ferrariae TaxID=1386098 RepID=UPI001C8BE04C|nr:extracellular solute-binding protein [Actinotalea ferrariae]MBX9245598.1 extracellular solute-binding protein [Actinotalea ferrariae]